MEVRLSPRLDAVAQAIGTCDTLADIGTDHAFLPVALVASGRCRRAFACDINEGPLRRAGQTVARAGCSDQVHLIRSDGLRNVPPEYDVLVVAGMGGDLIADILSACPPVSNARMFFQPMTKPEALRAYLYGAGYAIVRETAVCEGERVYLIMSVLFRSDPAAAERDPVMPFRLRNTEAARRYLQTLLCARRKRRDGLLRSARPDPRLLAEEDDRIRRLETYDFEENDL